MRVLFMGQFCWRNALLLEKRLNGAFWYLLHLSSPTKLTEALITTTQCTLDSRLQRLFSRYNNSDQGMQTMLLLYWRRLMFNLKQSPLLHLGITFLPSSIQKQSITPWQLVKLMDTVKKKRCSLSSQSRKMSRELDIVFFFCIFVS